MQEINQLNLSGTITKIYDVIQTPAGVLVSRFVLEHSSKQTEAEIDRIVQCRLYCVQIAVRLDEQLVGKKVNIAGFLNMNAKKQLVFHVNKLQILD